MVIYLGYLLATLFLFVMPFLPWYDFQVGITTIESRVGYEVILCWLVVACAVVGLLSLVYKKLYQLSDLTRNLPFLVGITSLILSLFSWYKVGLLPNYLISQLPDDLRRFSREHDLIDRFDLYGQGLFVAVCSSLALAVLGFGLSYSRGGLRQLDMSFVKRNGVVLTISGAFLFCVGLFSPLVSVTIVGSFSMMSPGASDGMIYLIAILAIVAMTLFRYWSAILVISVSVLLFLTNGLLNFAVRLESETGTIRFGWGWILLYLGLLVPSVTAMVMKAGIKTDQVDRVSSTQNMNEG